MKIRTHHHTVCSHDLVRLSVLDPQLLPSAILQSNRTWPEWLVLHPRGCIHKKRQLVNVYNSLSLLISKWETDLSINPHQNIWSNLFKYFQYDLKSKFATYCIQCNVLYRTHYTGQRWVSHTRISAHSAQRKYQMTTCKLCGFVHLFRNFGWRYVNVAQL